MLQILSPHSSHARLIGHVGAQRSVGAAFLTVHTTREQDPVVGRLTDRMLALSEYLEIVGHDKSSPFLRELDTACFDRADHVVFDAEPTQVFEESGDLMAVTDACRGRLSCAPVLPDVVAGGFDRGTADVTLFKSVGTAAQDIIAAKVVYDTAVEHGIGRQIGVLADAKQF